MTQPVEFLDIDDLIELACQLFGDPPPIHDIGLLGSAAARPQTTAFGTDAYPEIVTKAAALLQSIVNNHPLIDGNKRLGWLACAVFLKINSIDAARTANDDVFNLVMWVASTNPNLDEISHRLRHILPI